MKRIDSYQQLLDLSTIIRNKKKGYITNFYPDAIKHQIWLDRGALQYEEFGDTFFLGKTDNSFWNVFYISTSIAALNESTTEFLSIYSNRTLIFDIVGKKEQCQSIVENFHTHGFELATSLVRMQRFAQENDCFEPIDGVMYAEPDDLKEISNYLHTFFNPSLEQIPYDEELVSYINQNRILVVKEYGTLAGFLIFEKNATTLYLRYWFTKPEFREKKIGAKLLRQFFHEGQNTKRQILWVIDDNDNAIKRYIHYGFNNENMYDYVMRLK